MTFYPVPNHPECRRWFLGVNGPIEQRHRLIITREKDGEYHWRVKYAGERAYVRLGGVRRLRDPIREARIWRELRNVY